MNKTLETIEIEPSKLKDINVDGDGVTLTFDNDVVVLESYHDQDCCEHVYADFSIMDLYIKQLKAEYKKIVIKGVEGIGILVCFQEEYGSTEKVLVPCYNSQNGYYSDDLTLSITHKEITKKIDITDYKEDDLC